MLRNSFFVIPLCLVFSACSTPQMRVESGLQAAGTVHEVHGRQGWLIDQQLQFGEFLAGPVSRGWTKGYDYPFIVRFSGAREKLRFAVRVDEGPESLAHCIGKLRELDLRAFRDYFDVNLDTTDTFACSIAVDGSASYDFYAAHLNVQQNAGYKAAEGTLRGGAAAVALRPIWHLASGQRFLGTEPLGYEFLREGETIAAVETVNEGRVWLRGDLAQEERLVIATAAAALLLRSGLAQHNDGP